MRPARSMDPAPRRHQMNRTRIVVCTLALSRSLAKRRRRRPDARGERIAVARRAAQSAFTSSRRAAGRDPRQDRRRREVHGEVRQADRGRGQGGGREGHVVPLARRRRRHRDRPEHRPPVGAQDRRRQRARQGQRHTWSSVIDGRTPNGTAFTEFLHELDGGITPGGVTPCFAGKCDWRLPEIDELRGLISVLYPDCTVVRCTTIIGPTAPSFTGRGRT